MEIPRFWRTTHQRLRLQGEICPQGHVVFPPRDVCPDCGNDAKGIFNLSGKGEVYSHTTVYEALSGYEGNVPYTVALVKLDEGPMITAQLTDVNQDQIQIGMPVEMVVRKMRDDGDERGIIIYGPKFRPVFSSK